MPGNDDLTGAEVALLDEIDVSCVCVTRYSSMSGVTTT